MEFFELSTAPPNAMFDKIMAADNMRGPYTPSGPVGAGGYRPMPIPVFSHAKTVATLDRASVPQPGSAELARRGFIPSMAGMNLGPLNLQLIGQHQQQPPLESGSSLLRDGTMEKSKRNGRGEGGGRGSRGGGTAGRKRTRGGQMTESVTTGSVMEGSLSGGGGAQSTGRAAAANGARQQNNSAGEKAEKSTSRRQSGQGNKRGEKKQPQPVTPPLSDTPCTLYNGNPPIVRAADANGLMNVWTSGVLEIYGLRTRAVEINQYMVDIPLNDILKDSYEAPKLVLKDYQDPEKGEDEGTFDQKVMGLLQLFPVRPSNGEAAENVGSRAPKHSKVLLDLECPIPLDFDQGLPRQERTEIVTDKDTTAGSHMGAVTSGSSQGGTSFKIDGLPLLPFEDFMTRLELGPSDSLQSLISRAQTQETDLNVTTDIRMDSAVVDRCHQNGSIPPLPCSYPPVAPVKIENWRSQQRVWSIELPEAPTMPAKCEAVSSALDVPVGDDGESPKSPDSRRRKVESKTEAQTPEPMEVCVPASSSAPTLPFPCHEIQECAVPVKEEPRQVENAVVLSSEGEPNPMEVDACRIDNGAMAVTVTDRPETVSSNKVVMVESDHGQERSGGEAVRPLETPATLARPQEMDVGDRESKPEQGEQEVKVPVESNVESKPDQTVQKEQSPALPSLELKVVCPPPTESEPSSTYPAVPLSPGVTAAAHILLSFRNSFPQVEPEKSDGERERRRRVFQPYQGAPVQKAAKSVRVASINHKSGGDGAKVAKTNTDGGSVPPSRALVSERRKSLSQIDVPEKLPVPSPRNASGGGASTSSRGGGSHTAARTSGNLSVKCAAKESAKDSSSNKDAGGRTLSSVPPSSTGLPSTKSAHKGAKTNGLVPSSNPKGSAVTANFAKVPTACNTQRVAAGGSRSSRPPAHNTNNNNNNNTPASHGTAPVPAKSSRQSIPDGRQKGKIEGSARGAKSSRD